MPCRNDYPDEPTVSQGSYEKLRAELDNVTNMLCGLCRRLRNVDQDYFITNDNQLARWWVKHEAWDRKREKAEQAELDKTKKKQAALNKLSAEEKKLLGL